MYNNATAPLCSCSAVGRANREARLLRGKRVLHVITDGCSQVEVAQADVFAEDFRSWYESACSWFAVDMNYQIDYRSPNEVRKDL